MEKVDNFIETQGQFENLLRLIRKTILASGLEESFKWNFPTYTYKAKNVVSFGAFKNHCGIWFFQGALLKDPNKVLQNAQEGKTQAMRQWKLTSEDNFDEAVLSSYLNEAISNEQKGLKVTIKKKPLRIPDELLEVLDTNKELKKSFEAFPPGKQRDFAEHIAAAKKTETKTARLEKIIPLIMQGIGLHDKYKNC